MKKVLLAVDESKGSLRAAETMVRLFPCVKPEVVIVLYVGRMEGWSLMDEVLLSESEIKTLKESLEGTEHQKALDLTAKKVMDYYTSYLRDNGIPGLKPLVRLGHPAEEILRAANEEGAELIVLGSRGKRLHTLFMGSVSREVANSAEVPVLIAK